MSDANDRAVLRAIQMQNAIEDADAIGTPRGLRNLFPTNLIRSRVRQIPMQRKVQDIMTRRIDPDAVRTDTPTASAQAAQRAEQQSAGVAPREEGDPAYVPVLPRGDVPSPSERERELEEGEQGTPPTDPGPPPQRPQYVGNVKSSPALDMILLAAEAEDRDALASVPIINEQPSIAQFKANLLEWLDRLQAHRAAHEAARNLNARTQANEDGDGTSSYNGPNDGGGPA